MIHLPFTLLAYLLNGLSVLSNKILLNKIIPDPLIYVFYISLVSILAIVALPITRIPSFEVFLMASLSTILWTTGVYFTLKALKIGPVSRVIPIIGTLNPLILLLMASGTKAISPTQTVAVLLLTLGMVFLTLTDWRIDLPNGWGKLHSKEILFEILAGVFFATSYLVLREAYLKMDFLSVIVWSRLVLLPLGLIILLQPNLRAQIITSKGLRINFFSKNGLIFIGGQISGTISEFLLLFSISLANPALVNSLQGTQYIFLLIFALFLSKKYPAIFQEQYSFVAMLSKTAGIILIGVGLYILAFSSS